ncbi:MAG: hypothetical protein RXR08_10560 [Sulfolobaceae archaeon]
MRAKEYLARAEEAMEGKNVSFETKLLVDNLRSKIETYKYRFGERQRLKRTDCINYRYQILTLLAAVLSRKLSEIISKCS